MGSKKSEVTQSTNIPGAGPQGQRAMALMDQIIDQLGAQFDAGTLGDLASGEGMQVTPQDQAFIRQISNVTGELQRSQARDNFESMSQALEGQLLERGVEGSSIEAVQQALLGRQLQRSLDQGAMQREVTGAQQLQEQAFQRTGRQLNANQLLLQQILGGASSIAGMDLQARMAQPTMTQTTESPIQWGELAGAVLGDVAGNLVGG